MKYDSAILFDYLSFTAKHMNQDGIVELLGLQGVPFETIRGKHGWLQALRYNNIYIYYGGRDDCVFCDMSGTGCRAYETHGKGDWKALFEELRSDKENYNVTRLDIAFDETIGLFDLDDMEAKIKREEIVCKFRWGECDDGLLGNKGKTIYIGSPRSAIRFVFYDKAAERGREKEGHWVRLELRLRDENAESFLDKLPFYPIGELFVSVVNNYLRFVEPSETDSRKRRWETSPFWYNFIGSAGKLSLYEAPGEEYNLGNLDHFAISQAGAAAAIFVDIHGLDEYISRCRTQMLRSKNPRYKRLREQYSQGLLPSAPEESSKLPSDRIVTCICCGNSFMACDVVYYDTKTNTGLCRDCDDSGFTCR